MRSPYHQAIGGLIDFGEIVGTAIADAAKSVLVHMRGAGPVDAADADDEEIDDAFEESTDAELWGLAPVLYRPADATNDGAPEVIFVRRGDERVVVATKDRRWQDEVELAPGEVCIRWCGNLSDSVSIRPRVHALSSGVLLAKGVQVQLVTDDGTKITVNENGSITLTASSKVTISAPLINLGSATPADSVALAAFTNDRLDALEQFADAFCGATPVPMDGGASIQVQCRAVHTGAMPGVPTLSNSVASTKVKSD
jgi:hypothetical protein